MLFSDIAAALEALAPPQTAESYDNVGLLVGLPRTPVRGVLVNLDVTEAMLDEAVAKGCNLIVTHHPIWFTGRKRLNGEDYVSRIIMEAVKRDIGLYACHTNLDNIREGVNRRIADTIGLVDTAFLRPGRTFQADGRAILTGSGLVGTLPEPMGKQAFLAHIKRAFGCGGIRYADAAQETISRVAVCGGAGSFLTPDALAAGADAFVTADISYHKFFDGEGRMLLMDIGHHESEQFTSELIRAYLLGEACADVWEKSPAGNSTQSGEKNSPGNKEELSKTFPNFARYFRRRAAGEPLFPVLLSEIRTNPVRYC